MSAALLAAALGAGPAEAAEGALDGNPLRLAAWLRALGCISEQPAWAEELRAARSAYDRLRASQTPDVTLLDDPLGAGGGGQSEAWAAYYAARELQDEIQKDLDRLYPDGDDPFFAAEPTLSTLRRVLFAWAQSEPAVGYRQGMHEVCAPLLFVVHSAYEHLRSDPGAGGGDGDDGGNSGDSSNSGNSGDGGNSGNSGDNADSGNSGDNADGSDSSGSAAAALSAFRRALLQGGGHREADAFLLFGAVMRLLAPYYGACAVARDAPVLRLGEELVGVRLRRVAPAVAERLLALDVAPQLFVLKWVRLLFGREMTFGACLLVWDLLFAGVAAGRPFDALLLDVAAAMVLRVAETLRGADYDTCITVLIKYPKMDEADALRVLRAARDLPPARAAHARGDSAVQRLLSDVGVRALETGRQITRLMPQAAAPRGARDAEIAGRLERLAARLHTDTAEDWTLLATAASMDLLQIAEVLRGNLRLEDCTFQGAAGRAGGAPEAPGGAAEPPPGSQAA